MYGKDFDAYAKFEGGDASLSVSLFEQGLVWKVDTDSETPDDYIFIYAIVHHGNGVPNLFDYAHLSKKEFIQLLDDHVLYRANAIEQFSGQSREELINTFPYSVGVLIDYYGYENIFGGSYDGFMIVNPEDMGEDSF